MSTPFVFSEELPALLSVASDDIVLVWDTSAGRMKRCTVAAVDAIVDARGTASSTVVGFYGATGVDHGTIAATAVTAIATAGVFSAGKNNSRWAWASSTECQAFMTRSKQCQADLKTLMQLVNSTGLVAISAV